MSIAGECFVIFHSQLLALLNSDLCFGCQRVIVTRYVTCYDCRMIKNFKHQGLLKFFETGKTTGINAQHASRIRILLARLNVAVNPKDLDAPGFYLHELKGKRKNTWSLRVNKNWRITFSVVDGDAVDVDLEDYH